MSAFVCLESLAGIIFRACVKEILVTNHWYEVKDMLNAVSNVDSIGWMSQSVSEAIEIGILRISSIRDIGSLVPGEKRAELKSSSKQTPETSQFTSFPSSQTASSLNLRFAIQKIKDIVNSKEGEHGVSHINRCCTGGYTKEDFTGNPQNNRPRK